MKVLSETYFSTAPLTCQVDYSGQQGRNPGASAAPAARPATRRCRRFDTDPDTWYPTGVKIESNIQFQANRNLADLETLLAALTRAGYSNTRARRAVVRALRDTGGQATPAELLTLGRVHHPALGLVTVYRTLDILDKLGLVRKLHLDAGCHSYAISALAVQHAAPDAAAEREASHVHSHHIICQRCSQAVEFEGCDLGIVVASVEAQTGFRVREHWLEMFGVCPECQKAGDAETRGQGECVNEESNDD